MAALTFGIRVGYKRPLQRKYWPINGGFWRDPGSIGIKSRRVYQLEKRRTNQITPENLHTLDPSEYFIVNFELFLPKQTNEIQLNSQWFFYSWFITIQAWKKQGTFFIINGLIMANYMILALYSLTAILWIWALIDIFRSRFIKKSVKGLWLLAILFFPIIGSIIYFQVGRKAATNKRRRLESYFQ